MENVGIDVGITLYMLMDNFPMRDLEDINFIWAKTVKRMRSKLLDRGLQM